MQVVLGEVAKSRGVVKWYGLSSEAAPRSQRASKAGRCSVHSLTKSSWWRGRAGEAPRPLGKRALGAHHQYRIGPSRRSREAASLSAPPSSVGGSRYAIEPRARRNGIFGVATAHLAAAHQSAILRHLAPGLNSEINRSAIRENQPPHARRGRPILRRRIS